MVFQAVGKLLQTYPVTRGIMTYTALWPMANVTQQIIMEKNEIDVKRVIRYGLWGGFFVAPTLYIWVRLAARMFPGTSLVVAVKKVMAEQVLWSPFAISSFLIGMNLMEGKSTDYIAVELSEKFIPTYKTGMCFWPFIQTINFAFIKEKNRVPFVGVFSYLWTIFLSYVQQRKIDEEAAGRSTSGVTK